MRSWGSWWWCCSWRASPVWRWCNLYNLGNPLDLIVLQAVLGLAVVVLLMAGIICVALVQTRSAYTASFGTLLDAAHIQGAGSGNGAIGAFGASEKLLSAGEARVPLFRLSNAGRLLPRFLACQLICGCRRRRRFRGRWAEPARRVRGRPAARRRHCGRRCRDRRTCGALPRRRGLHGPPRRRRPGPAQGGQHDWSETFGTADKATLWICTGWGAMTGQRPGTIA